MGASDTQLGLDALAPGISDATTGDRVRLAQLCAPYFLLLSSFRRNSAASAIAPGDLRAQLLRQLDGIKDRCARDDVLERRLKRAWYPLVVAADQVVLSSQWSERVSWSMDLLETHVFQTAEGGHRFYQIVNEVLAEGSEEAAEVAEVLFTCMGLGFQGEFIDQPRQLERNRRALYEKARLPGALGDVLTPQAYGRNSVGKEIPLPKVGLARVALLCVIALIVAYVAGRTISDFRLADLREDIAQVRARLEPQTEG